MSVLVQISDPHFGTERVPVAEALVQLVHGLAPELVVLSGDITQRATPTQFAAARAFADRLRPAAVLAIPGNHDVPLFNPFARLFSPYARHQRAFGAELEPVHRSPDWLVIGVKTTRRWRHKHGQVSAAQIERVAQALHGASPAQVRVVVVHQPVAVARDRDATDLLRGHEAAVRRWSAAGADLVAGGHIHLPYVLALHGLHADLARRAWCVQAGTAISSRTRAEAGNSVNVLRRSVDGAGRRHAVVERWDYVDVHGCFEQAAQHDLDLETREAA
ncbi:metallophosphoesterase [Pseudorhodoferax sp. Leaf267]|uniref:metallophosphoesterase family protein n=1 Tax=Pseudorhodoferax sp. Leaf267 TaxID=1736316 RepID=UPI0006F87AD8|nr:metallophosphoesterase [Pseudorhodoferax sp. Leaf267]KQP19237.1 DNA repair exonuclease [Pseudorhodoferax sp. Leaf267]